MSLIVKRATLASMAATFLMLVYSAAGSGAAAQEKTPVQAQTDSIPAAAPTGTQAETAPVAAPSADSLAELVAAQPDEAQVSDEINCLAGAIYFEARNEPLDGQLAVGRVIVNRSKSGRFPASYCGVVNQPSQFSFVHHHTPVKTSSRTWRNAVAVARIAHADRWKSPAEGALYFHAARVKPHWAGRVRVAQIENHVFYR